ncbi:MAG: outer membrane lipoprotein carrier protein LolA [Bacteroidetes bacterium]|nr:outer membrane lipoprotein carrier protein LolA [Bacteroidota bacterium]
MKLYSLLLLFLPFTLLAQPTGFSSVKDITSFKTNFTKASQALESVSSDFVQIKNLSMLKDKITSSGKFYYKKGNKVRLEYKKPFYYLMVLNGGSMMVKDEQKQSNYNTHSNKMMQSINNIMMDCMSGNVYKNKDFTTQVFENPKEFLLQMTPSTSMMKKLFSKIEVSVSKTDYRVLRLNMIENGGDNSLMTFSGHVLNKPLDETLFATK